MKKHIIGMLLLFSIYICNGMSSFSEKVAKEVKNYFDGMILESFRGLFDDPENNLQQHRKMFESDVPHCEFGKTNKRK